MISVFSEEYVDSRLLDIYNIISCTYNDPTIVEAINRMEGLNAYLAESAKIVADAKFNLLKAKQKAYDDYLSLGKTLPPSVVTDYIKSRCPDQERAFSFAERINASITHQIDSLRTITSALKSELRLVTN